jgi:hypothetical protein
MFRTAPLLTCSGFTELPHKDGDGEHFVRSRLFGWRHSWLSAEKWRNSDEVATDDLVKTSVGRRNQDIWNSVLRPKICAFDRYLRPFLIAKLPYFP